MTSFGGARLPGEGVQIAITEVESAFEMRTLCDLYTASQPTNVQRMHLEDWVDGTLMDDNQMVIDFADQLAGVMTKIEVRYRAQGLSMQFV